MMARRMAGRLGDGGGPPAWSDPRLSPPSAGGREPQVLQKGEGDAGHERVSAQPRPRAALEVAEAQLLFELLVRLLADPARLDRGGEGAQRRPGRQVAQVELALAGGSPLADEPGFLAGLGTGVWRGRPRVARGQRSRTAVV